MLTRIAKCGRRKNRETDKPVANARLPQKAKCCLRTRRTYSHARVCVSESLLTLTLTKIVRCGRRTGGECPTAQECEMLSTHQARVFACACMRFGILVKVIVNENREMRRTHRRRTPDCPGMRNAVYAPGARIRLRAYAFRNNC